MPKHKKPRYCLHKATGQARVSFNGKTYYLGKYDSPESRARYDQRMIAWNGGHPLTPSSEFPIVRTDLGMTWGYTIHIRA